MRAGVVALSHALRRVVVLPERLEQLLVTHHLRIEHDQDHLGVSREAGAHLLVGGVGREAAGVAGGGAPHARHLPEHALGSPEASHPEDGRLEALREGRLEAVAVHEVPLGHRDPLRAAAQGFVLLDHPGLLPVRSLGRGLEKDDVFDHCSSNAPVCGAARGAGERGWRFSGSRF